MAGVRKPIFGATGDTDILKDLQNGHKYSFGI